MQLRNHFIYWFLSGIFWFLFQDLNLYGQTEDPRLAAYDIHFCFLDLEVSHRNSDIRGNVDIQASLTDIQTDTLALELIDQATTDSVLLNGKKVPFLHVNDLITFPLEEMEGSEQDISIQVFYSLTNGDIIAYRGINTKEGSEGDTITWTLSEPFYSKYWFPCKQDLTDKIDSACLYFTTENGTRVGSNGLLTHITDMGGDKKRFEWKTSYPMAYYLLSFSVGNYLDYSFSAPLGNGDSVLVQNYIYNDSSYFRTIREDIDATGPLLELFSEKFGTYPFSKEKYGHCLAPTGGGMEHQTMTTLSSFDFGLVAHELAHQWFGDHVTCANWQDIWLNEGFASYAELIALENLKSTEDRTDWLRTAHALITEEEGGSVFIPESEKETDKRIFDYRLTYRKGAYLIHMIRHELNNDDLFYRVLKTYLDQYGNSVVTTPEFRTILETVSGQNFSVFFDQWYYGEGYPVLDFAWRQRNDSLIIKIDQETSAPEITPFFELSIDFKISYLGGDTLIRYKHTTNAEEFSIPMDKRVYLITPDPDKWLLAQIRSVQRQFEGDTAAQFAVFPNPSRNLVYIENYQIGLPYNAKLFNSRGLLIDETENSDAFFTFDFGKLTTDIYQILITRDTHREVYKVARP